MKEYTAEEVKNIIFEQIINVTSDYDSWIDFLKRAAFFYKYSVSEQLIITAVKPNATACAVRF